ncbi:hypothetical protein [uncultured Campylobacter sp.]|uniref:hypothetical protein n=1 Tax=uncultured Campylobacter sp. TaxID=218934 RepID=UPI0025F74F17|nr:hypothetical protein [uncultured Campylobacter sp.]
MCFAKRIALYGVGTVLLAEQCGSVVQSEKWFIGGAGGQNAMCDEKIATMKF